MDLAAAFGACILFCAKALRLQRVSRFFCEASARRALPTTIWTEMQSQVSSVKCLRQGTSSAAWLGSRSACHILCTKLDPDHVVEIADGVSAAAHALSDYDNKVAEDDRLLTQVDEPPR